jgi:secreted trypsin-like serine protease
LLDLQPILERAVNRISNHQAIGIGTPVAGAAAKAVTGSGAVSVVASVLKGVLDNPSVKSRLAIAISKSSKIPISQAISRVQSYSSALGASAAGPIAADSQAYPTADSPSQPTMSQP